MGQNYKANHSFEYDPELQKMIKDYVKLCRGIWCIDLLVKVTTEQQLEQCQMVLMLEIANTSPKVKDTISKSKAKLGFLPIVQSFWTLVQ
jgi:hypothetical protein